MLLLLYNVSLCHSLLVGSHTQNQIKTLNSQFTKPYNDLTSCPTQQFRNQTLRHRHHHRRVPIRRAAIARRREETFHQGPPHQGQRPRPPRPHAAALRRAHFPAHARARPPIRRRDHRVAPPPCRDLHYSRYRLRHRPRRPRLLRWALRSLLRAHGRLPRHGGRRSGNVRRAAAAELPARPFPAAWDGVRGERLPAHAVHCASVAAGDGGRKSERRVSRRTMIAIRI
ncbi:hypothetical protein GLYMA_13G144100v4 [Glycine max]|nr:hypothetical protein GLYMA_13G144100v4 [Glycine max]KAG4383716.1 hypothetical protein GLYMA_13G144100v4 [Glycine max]KAH1101503.1 hypothetical protein GYH30_036196 [Glycine max]KAH1101504.1 hypothetical protein GYH30_036196 [Glycine max]